MFFSNLQGKKTWQARQAAGKLRFCVRLSEPCENLLLQAETNCVTGNTMKKIYKTFFYRREACGCEVKKALL